MRESRRTGVGEPAPASLRVANPRQGDFAKPDCENEGRRPAFPPTLLTSEQTDRSSPSKGLIWLCCSMVICFSLGWIPERRRPFAAPASQSARQ